MCNNFVTEGQIT